MGTGDDQTDNEIVFDLNRAREALVP